MSAASASRQSLPFDPPGEVHETQQVAEPTDPGRWINQYRVIATVGTGQHGTVYLCHQIIDGSPVERALKQVKRHNPSTDRWKKLQRAQLPTSDHVAVSDQLGPTELKIRKEIAIMKKCRHANVVRLLEVIDDRLLDKIYIIMEYMGGGEVKWKNANDEPILTLAQTRRIIRDAIIGIEYLHHQGIIHRDIKPANLLWTEDRSAVKIADFGVSHFSYAQRMAAATATHEPISVDDPRDPLLLDDSELSKRAGTPSFLAPEIIYEHTLMPIGVPESSRIHPPITKAIDIWSLGVTMYCLLFAHTPFRPEEGAGRNEFSMYNNICNKPWPVDPTMGFDRVSTSNDQPNSEAHDVLNLLSLILEKDAYKRIELQDIKRHPWITRDLHNPGLWVQKTSPWQVVPVLQATDIEAGTAMSNVLFRWSWKATISRIFRIRPQRNPRRDQPHTVKINTPTVTRRKSSAEPKRKRTNTPPTMSRPDSFSGTGVSLRSKGKQRAELVLDHEASRSKSTERWQAFRKHNSSSMVIEGSGAKPRRGSETLHLSGSDDAPPSPMARMRSSIAAILGWHPNKFAPTEGPVDGSMRSSRKKNALETKILSPQQTASIDNLVRQSEDAFHSYRTGRGTDSGALTAARRASSWGDNGADFSADVVSVVSDDVELDDQAMIVGVGGVSDDLPYHLEASSGSALPATILHQQDHFVAGPHVPTKPDPSMQDTTFSRTGSRLTSPLVNEVYNHQDPRDFDQRSLDSSNFGSVIAQRRYDYDDEENDYYSDEDDALEISTKKDRGPSPQTDSHVHA